MQHGVLLPETATGSAGNIRIHQQTKGGSGMKTVEQAAQEFNDSISYEGSSDRVAFTAGVEFAESWIPVEEEMPEQMTESDYSAEVLTQTKNGYYWLNQYDYESKAWTESPSGDPVINWRPINRKA